MGIVNIWGEKKIFLLGVVLKGDNRLGERERDRKYMSENMLLGVNGIDYLEITFRR